MNDEVLRKLRSGSVCTGTWLSIGSPVIAEVAADSGFDWLLFDLEHGCGSESGLLANLQAIRGSGAAAVVRVPTPQADLVLRVLDWGAEGIMVPHVSNAADAERCIQAAHYPPRGKRGFSRSARAYGYGAQAPGSSDLPSPPYVIVQIETIEGVENAAEIAGIQGVDALFIGPTDLKFAIARSEDPPPEFDHCVNEVAMAAREAGKAWGILVRDENEIASLRAQGATLLAVDSDLGILRRGYQQIIGNPKRN